MVIELRIETFHWLYLSQQTIIDMPKSHKPLDAVSLQF